MIHKTHSFVGEVTNTNFVIDSVECFVCIKWKNEGISFLESWERHLRHRGGKAEALANTKQNKSRQKNLSIKDIKIH